MRIHPRFSAPGENCISAQIHQIFVVPHVWYWLRMLPHRQGRVCESRRQPLRGTFCVGLVRTTRDGPAGEGQGSPFPAIFFVCRAFGLGRAFGPQDPHFDAHADPVGPQPVSRSADDLATPKLDSLRFADGLPSGVGPGFGKSLPGQPSLG